MKLFITLKRFIYKFLKRFSKKPQKRAVFVSEKIILEKKFRKAPVKKKGGK